MILLRIIIGIIGLACVLTGIAQGNIVLIIVGLVLLAAVGIWMWLVGDFDGDGGVDVL